MRTLYLDCSMGAAGDMLAAALFELVPDREAMLAKLNSLGIPGVTFRAEKSEKCGICGTHLAVEVCGEEEGEHHHHHHTLHDISHILSHLRVSKRVAAQVQAVYAFIAEAESKVHGVETDEVHFHEVGALDAIADITAFCLMLEELPVDEVRASPVHVGSGTVRCAHGVLPVPAPATAELLRGVPIYGGEIQGELCTPTGAAILKVFATKFGEMPLMCIEKIGYGMGKKDFPRANCVRAILGGGAEEPERIVELSCNVDDMTGEAVGFAIEELLRGGAVEAFYTPVGMKKSRPGILLTALCYEEDRDAVVQLLLKHTTTLGVRETLCRRYVLTRSVTEVETPLGKVRRKDSSGYGITRSKYEHDDLARLAREHGCSLEEILRQLP
ncbi:MAG: nickel pincer cofactor biosynthesis protein LarC [Oscillospiraceae bacterium]|nr:nickel pincer cofactor biosynthesis protein LarC [Oscillospiraceae bacterium]